MQDTLRYLLRILIIIMMNICVLNAAALFRMHFGL